MFAKRATAAKLSIQDIQDGNLIANERGNVVGVETYLGQVSRVSVIATVVDRYKATQERLSEEGRGFATLSLDDGTGVIRVKMWGELTQSLMQSKWETWFLLWGACGAFREKPTSTVSLYVRWTTRIGKRFE